jgi:hypothetical protein
MWLLITDQMNESGSPVSCPIPDVCIDERRLPLFIARTTLRDVIARLEARATGGATQ